MAELHELSVAALAKHVANREVSPVEVVDHYLDRIDRLNTNLNAIVILVDSAREAAKVAEKAVDRGASLGAFHGVPITVKDSIDLAGVPTSLGSKLFVNSIPAKTALSVERLVGAGAIPIAKTNIPEFSLWHETDNLVFGRTLNPVDFARTAGGSSGGEAAAIAARLSPLGLGTDLSGSIRLPAHHCGVVGLKPTHGLVPTAGVHPDVLPDFVHVGPLGRTVEDVASALAVLSGPDRSGWRSIRLPYSPPSVDLSEDQLGELRIGWSAGTGFAPVDADVHTAVEGAARAVAPLVREVVEVDLTVLGEIDVQELTLAYYAAGGSKYFRTAVGDRASELHPELRRRIGLPPPSLETYLEAERDIELLRQSLFDYFAEYDILICPASPVPAHKHDMERLEVEGTVLPPRYVMRATMPFNLTGSPAVSVPFDLSTGGLPVGVQVVGRHLEDGRVLSVAAAIEKQRPVGPAFPPAEALSLEPGMRADEADSQ